MAIAAVRVRRSILEECMTCPLCNNLLNDATTISECLHTFCRNCIYVKLTDEELSCCPICNTSLGCVPVEKLRADHNIQEITTHIFPSNRIRVNTPEPVPSVSVPVEIKEMSVSTLGVNNPQVPPQPKLTGRRAKIVAKKADALRGSSFTPDENFLDDYPDSSNSSKAGQNRRQKSSLSEPPNCNLQNRNSQNVDESKAEKDPMDASNSATLVPKNNSMEHADKANVQDDSSGTSLAFPELMNPRKTNRMGRKRGSCSKGQGISFQAVLDATCVQQARGTAPLWFTLVASQDQEGYGSLPQISSKYLKIKDGYLPVSFIQKYLMMKLNLTSENEVEIKCEGERVPPTLQIKELLTWWLQMWSPSHRVEASVGASAEQFVMVLHYERNLQSS